jgi:hypothetical protein
MRDDRWMEADQRARDGRSEPDPLGCLGDRADDAQTNGL